MPVFIIRSSRLSGPDCSVNLMQSGGEIYKITRYVCVAEWMFWLGLAGSTLFKNSVLPRLRKTALPPRRVQKPNCSVVFFVVEVICCVSLYSFSLCLYIRFLCVSKFVFFVDFCDVQSVGLKADNFIV